MRRLGDLLLVLLAAGLLSACADLEIEVALNEDGSGTLRTAVSLNRALLDGLSDGHASAASLLTDAGLDASTFPTGVLYQPVDTDEVVGFRLEIPFTTGADPAAQIDEAFASLGPDVGPLVGPGGPFEAFTLTRNGDAWRFEATTASSDSPDGLSALLTQDASFTFRLRLPGEVTSTNADRTRDDGTLEWDLPLDGSSRSLAARATAGGSSGVPRRLGFVGVALAAGLALAAAAWLVRPGNRSQG